MMNRVLDRRNQRAVTVQVGAAARCFDVPNSKQLPSCVSSFLGLLAPMVDVAKFRKVLDR